MWSCASELVETETHSFKDSGYTNQVRLRGFKKERPIAHIKKSAIAQIESTQNSRKITVYNPLARELAERPNADKRLLSPLKSKTTSNLTWGIVCRRNWKCPSASERLRKRATIIHCWVGNRRAIAQQCKRSLYVIIEFISIAIFGARASPEPWTVRGWLLTF